MKNNELVSVFFFSFFLGQNAADSPDRVLAD